MLPLFYYVVIQWYILYRETRLNAWFLPWKYLFSDGIVGVEKNDLQFMKS